MIASERARVEPELSRLRKALSGKKGFVAAGAAFAHGLLAVLRELGVRVDGAYSFHHDPSTDSGDPRQDTLNHLVETLGDIPNFTVSPDQHFQAHAALQRSRPDFVICRHSGSMAVLSARIGIPVLPIFYSNDGLGYEGLLTIGRAILRILPRALLPGYRGALEFSIPTMVAETNRSVCARKRPVLIGMATLENSAQFCSSNGPIEQVRYGCSLGALASVIAIPGAIPITHCGPGCATKQFHALSGLNAYQGGEFHVPSTNIGNREVIFGGADRLDELIAATLKVMQADLFVVQSGCIPGLVGDDVASVVGKYRRKGVPIVFAETSGYRGNNFTGYETIIRAIIDQFIGAYDGPREPGLVNVWSLLPYQNPFWRGDLGEIRCILEGIGLACG